MEALKLGTDFVIECTYYVATLEIASKITLKMAYYYWEHGISGRLEI
jgi:hypothetical protein